MNENVKKKILVINDSKSIREIIQFYLEMKNYEVYQAIDGYEGIEKAKKVMPDLILLDVIMPGLDGYQTCEKLKQDPKIQEIPVIFLSSLSNTQDKIKGLESGGVDFINNTTDQAELLARIETHLKIRDLTQELKTSNRELILKQKALNDDLRAAAIIQQSLLPIQAPIIPNVKVAWFCNPCELIGGDICNITHLNHENLSLYILDVSGHGVPSAMVTVSMTQYLGQKQQLLQSSLSPKQLLMDLNQEYPFEKFNMFSTIFYMTLNIRTGKLSYSSAGHPPAVYLSLHKELKLLNPTGPLIGLDRSFTYDEEVENLQAGDKVILYTDGIIELRNPNNEFYGAERFYALLEKIKYYSINSIIQLVSSSLQEFAQGRAPQDDISILGVEFQKSG